MLRFFTFAVVAALTLSSVPAFARGKGGAKSSAKKVPHHKTARRH